MQNRNIAIKRRNEGINSIHYLIQNRCDLKHKSMIREKNHAAESHSDRRDLN